MQTQKPLSVAFGFLKVIYYELTKNLAFINKTATNKSQDSMAPTIIFKSEKLQLKQQSLLQHSSFSFNSGDRHCLSIKTVLPSHNFKELNTFGRKPNTYYKTANTASSTPVLMKTVESKA